jgi:Flp pilus assembly protein TadD
VAVIHDNLGTLLAGLDKLGEAEPEYRAALKIRQRLADEQPNVNYRSNLAIYHKDLGIVLLSQGKQAESETEYRAAITYYQRLADENPNDANSHNNLAWLLATCPDVKLRDPGQAVAHAQKAVELAPGSGTFWNTLGVAQYHNGAWKAASKR